MADVRMTACFTFDFDAMSSWVQRKYGATEISRGEFGAFAMPRILDLLARHEIITTFFIPGHSALAYPDLVRRIRDAGHEIGHHGWVHENAGEGGAEAERVIFERGFEALDRAAGVRPIGYRAAGANADFSEESVNMLREFGFVYDSSCAGADFRAYYLRMGDEFSPTEHYTFGTPSEIVELPVWWPLDDFNLLDFRPGYTDRQAPPSEVGAMWQEEYDFAHEHEPGGIYNVTLHPQVIGRGPRLAMLERLIEHIEELGDVRFETLESYARRWKDENPLDEWLATDPVHAGLSAIKLDGTSASKARVVS